MSNFILSAFGDEIAAALNIQLEILSSHNIKFIEMRGVNGRSIADFSINEAREIKKQLDERGISVSAIGSPIGKIKVNDNFDEHLELFNKLLDIARVLDTSYIRVFSFYIPKGDKPEVYKDDILLKMKRLTDRAAEKGIILLHENEKDIYGDTAERCLEIVEYVNSPNLRLTFDPANFAQCKVEAYPHAYKLLRKHIEYVHIKDAIFESGHVVPAGLGDCKILEMLKDLKVSGYKGFLSIEPHLAAFEGLEKLENGRNISKIKENGISAFSVAFDALDKILKLL